jgi:hypothetical protein
MAVEIFLKMFLARKAGLTEPAAIAFGHNLSKILNACHVAEPKHDVLHIQSEIGIFPDISDRYTGPDLPEPTLWKAYGLAQYTAAAVIRSFTDRDTRPQIRTSTTA